MWLKSSILPIQTGQVWTNVNIQVTQAKKCRLLKLMASEAETEFEVVVGWSVVHNLLTVTESLLSGKTAVSA